MMGITWTVMTTVSVDLLSTVSWIWPAQGGFWNKLRMASTNKQFNAPHHNIIIVEKFALKELFNGETALPVHFQQNAQQLGEQEANGVDGLSD